MVTWLNKQIMLRVAASLSLACGALSLGGSWLRSPFSQEGSTSGHRGAETVLPAKVEAGAQFDVVAEYGGRIKALHFSNGERVAAGQLLVTLENSELSAAVATAEKRLEAAESRWRALAARHSARYENEVVQSATRARRAAQERLDSYTSDPKQRVSAVAEAKKRVAEIQSLVSQGLAVSSELQDAQAREDAAKRDLQSSQEHLSRLRQELDDADSRLRLARLQPSNAGAEVAAAAQELEEAKGAVTITRERESRLTLRAPGAGTVLISGQHSGEWVSAGTRLLHIADASMLTLSAPVSAIIARTVSPGDSVHVRLPTDPPRRVVATVASVDLTPDPFQRAYLIRVKVPNPSPDLALVGLEGAIELKHGVRQ